LHHVRKRFLNGNIYTFVGSILVAVNPFKSLDIYNNEQIKKAESIVTMGIPYPHVFVTGAIAFKQLRENAKNQSVLISGESGAGKTETTKKVLTYLASVSEQSKATTDSTPIQDKILQSNPLLEALGNAKTLRNNNSSRFGKWMKVDYDSAFRISGCEIVNYLLEKSRVVKQTMNERNYHIFYQLLSGTSGEQKEQFFLQDPEYYAYLNTSNCTTISGVDDKEEFRDVLKSLVTLQFSSELIDMMFQILSAILMLGNIQFDDAVEDGNDVCYVAGASSETIMICANLLGVDVDPFSKALTTRIQQVTGRRSIYTIKLSKGQAQDNRDTLAKSLYGNLFDWCIKCINKSLKTDNAPYSIGILDIFGFEVFDVNSFEQLCINYANEKLQLHFSHVIFNQEMKMYEDEGYSANKITFVDNSECVALIEGKPYGLLSILDEECTLGKATDMTYINKIGNLFSSGKPQANKFFFKHQQNPVIYTVKHFAGGVEYNVTNFLDKNRDTLNPSVTELMQGSQSELVKNLFPADVAEAAAASGKKSTKSTLGGQFRAQLIGLVTTLNQTEAHFIRCVKSNHQKAPLKFDGPLALRQLRYAGLFEAIKIRKSGFEYRASKQSFADKYQYLVDDLPTKRKKDIINTHDSCEIILKSAIKIGALSEDTCFVGTTRVFIKTNNEVASLDAMRIERTWVFALKIQKVLRGYNTRCRVFSVKYEKIRRAIEAQKRLEVINSMATIIQKYARRFIVLKTILLMRNMVALRKALAFRDVAKLETTLKILESDKASQEKIMHSFMSREISIAKMLLRLIKIQDQYIIQLTSTLHSNDVVKLNKLVEEGEKLKMTAHPMYQLAKENLSKQFNKRTVMKNMLEFLRKEDFKDGANINELLEEARRLCVDQLFIDKVQRIYESTGPRLRQRNRLRRAIEVIDWHNVKQASDEAKALQESVPGFAAVELRAAAALERLLHFDELLDDSQVDPSNKIESSDESPEVQSDTSSMRNYRKDKGPLLNDEVIDICNKISSESDPKKKQEYRQKLKDMTSNQKQYESFIRYYKWSKLLCVWKYPEVADDIENQNKMNKSPEEFYALRIDESRTSLNLIRTLHQDVDSHGNMSASLHAELSSLDLPGEVIETFQSLDEIVRIDAMRKKEKKENDRKTELALAERLKKEMAKRSPKPKFRMSVLELAQNNTELAEQLQLSRQEKEKQKKLTELTFSKLERVNKIRWK